MYMYQVIFTWDAELVNIDGIAVTRRYIKVILAYCEAFFLNSL